jgi:hypothetical protein
MWAKTVWVTLLWAAVAATAQENAPPGFLRGDLLSWTGTRNGQFMFRAAPADRVYSCSYDDKTYVERDNQRITLALAQTGDHLELVSDRRLGSPLCYARTVHVLEPQRTFSAPGVRPRLRTTSAASALFVPHPNLSFSGAVVRMTSDALILRSRSGERRVVRLRPDTRYIAQGQTAEPDSLPVNTLVFIRGGRNLYDEVEAYQVIWGEILQPAP